MKYQARLGIGVNVHKHEISLFYETRSKLFEGQFLLHTDEGIYDFEVALSGDLYAFNFVAPPENPLSVSLKEVALELFGEEALIEDFPAVKLTCRQFFFLYLKNKDSKKKQYAAGLELAMDGISFDEIKTEVVRIESSKLSLDTILLAYGSDDLKVKKKEESSELSDEDEKYNKAIAPILTFLNIDGLDKGFSVGALVKEGKDSYHAIPPMKAPEKEAITLVPINSALQVEKKEAKKKLAKIEKWAKLNKKIGPVLLQGIGVRFLAKQQSAQLLLNANLKIAAVELELIELGMKIDIKHHFHVSPTISGLGLGISTKSFSLAGAFMKQGKSNYAGMLDLKIGDLEISGIGAYQEKDGHKSIFGYALLQYPLGGSPQFYVNGLAAGFGYNREVVIPKIDEINAFPLIRWAMGDRLPNGDKQSQLEKFPALVQEIDQSIPVKLDEDWLAIGVKFNSFKILDGFILFMASFGNRFELDLLGLAELNIPKKSKDAVIHIELELKARFAPDEGLFSLEAALSKRSYILSKTCRMSGGLAYFMWFSGKHANDFVLSIGGYHPNFKKPTHYPNVERLALNWKVSDYVQISGAGYFALTPSCLMAGFKSRLFIHVSAIKVTFSMSADFLMRWAPFYYELLVKIGLNVEFSKKKWGIRVHFKFGLHASLHIFGPDFSGRATIHHPIVSFSIKFGSNHNKPAHLSWDEFSNKYLIQDSASEKLRQSLRTIEYSKLAHRKVDLSIQNAVREVFNIKPIDGLIEQVLAKNDSGAEVILWIVDPEYLKIRFSSSIPIKKASGLMKASVEYSDDLGIRPMGLDTKDFSSHVSIDFKKNTAKPKASESDISNDLLQEKLSVKAISENVPAGLWGNNTSGAQVLKSKTTIDNVLKGCEIQVVKPQRSEKFQRINPSPEHIGKYGRIDMDKHQYSFDTKTSQNFKSALLDSTDRHSILTVLQSNEAFFYLKSQFEEKDCEIDYNDLDQLRYEDPLFYDVGSDTMIQK